MVLSILILLVLKNPLLEQRSGFATIYLFLTWIFFRKSLDSTNKFLVFIIPSFAFFFPLAELLNPLRWDNYQGSIIQRFLGDYYNTIHFDAWANTVAAFDYVKNNGHTYGRQLLSTLLFWVPRQFWELKSVASGQLLGTYMMEKYNFWMSNISFSIIAEAFRFFFQGIIYGIIFAKLSSWIDNVCMAKPILILMASLYFVLIFFILCISLSSFAYSFGGSIGIYFMCKLCEKISSKSY